MSSGYSVDKAVVQNYHIIKNGKQPPASKPQKADQAEEKETTIARANRPRFFTMNLDNTEHSVVVCDSVARTEDCQVDVQTLHTYLPDKEARFVVVDMDVDLGQGERREKLVFIQWVPDQCPIKERMLYASTVDIIKKKMDGLNIYMHGADKGDVEYKDICERCKKN